MMDSACPAELTIPGARELRAEIRQLGPWHQDLEIAPGVHTGERDPGTKDPLSVGSPGIVRPGGTIEQIVREVFTDGFAGRSVLDCACNAGGYLFEARRRGAGRCFGFDVREHWINQARFLARHLPSEGMQFAQHDLMKLRELKLEPFDVTLFFGIFYHLPDPMTALGIAAEHTRELLVVNTAATGRGRGDTLALSMESDTLLMSGVHRLAWMPTSARVVQEILKYCGFPHTRVHYIRRQTAKYRRIQVLGARDARIFERFDVLHPEPRRPLWKRVARRLIR
jgi:SAM-dependent methyltransferase